MAIQICVPREVREGEQRVALVPDIVNRLSKAGLIINIQASAGELVGYTDTVSYTHLTLPTKRIV